MARDQAGLTSPIIQMTTPVTPIRHDAGSTVLDARGRSRAQVPTAQGGDVGGTDQISMPLK
jgi:hypothetical protein